MWSDAGVEGAHRFLQAAVDLRADARATRQGRAGDARLRERRGDACRPRGARSTSTLKQANYDYERIQYNTVVSAGMKMLNALEALPADAARRARAAPRRPVDPAARALSRWCRTRRGRCGDELGFARELGDLLDAPWPQVDPAALVQDEIELVLQVNGKLRGKIVVPADADNAAIEAAARASAGGREARGRRAGEEGHRRAGQARQCRRLNAACDSLATSVVAALARRCSRGLRLPPARRGRRTLLDDLHQRRRRTAVRRRA